MAAKTSGEVTKSPEAESTRKLPEKLGGGEVRLYDAHKRGLPDLVPHPPEKLLAETQWFLVHFPSRKWVAVNAGRAEGMRQLKKLERGEDELGLIPLSIKEKKSRASAHVCAREECEKSATAPPKEKMEPTPVPEGADFDQAMAHVFPVKRITEHYERLLTAEEDVFDKEGHHVGSRPAFNVQFQALRSLVEYHQGRPTEKAKKKDERPVLTLEEMRTKMVKSPAYLEAVEEMVKEAREAAKLKTSSLKPPPRK